MIRYAWPAFVLEHDPATGYTVTLYADQHRSGCGVVPGDQHHAPLLGITPERHRLAHELAHHLVGLHFYRQATGSPVVYRDAHQVDNVGRASELEEWMTTALTYAAFGRECEIGALMDLQNAGCSVAALAREIRVLLSVADLPGERTVQMDAPPASPVALAA